MLGAEPVLVVPALASAPDLVTYCKGRGEILGVRCRAGTRAGSGAEVGPAMKKVDPGAQIVVALTDSPDEPLLRDAAPFIDYVSVHRTEDPAKFNEAPAAAEAQWRRAEARIAASSNPKIELLIADWSAGTADWRTGLYAATLLHAMERDPHIALAAAALNPIQSAILELYRASFAPSQLAMSGGSAGIDAVAARSADGEKIIVKLVNSTSRESVQEVSLRGDFPLLSASMKLIAPDRLNATTVHTSDAAVEPAGSGVRVRLPRWSVAVLTLSR